MHIPTSKYHLRLAVLVVMLLALFSLFGSLRAQDVTPTDTPVATDVPPTATPTDIPTQEPPTAAPTDIPTQEPPTAAPTDSPTQEPPTAAPTDVPAQDTSTQVAPTDSPTQDATLDATATTEITLSPTVVSAPPVFNFADGTTFDVGTATPLVIQGTVSDVSGMVTVMAAGSAGTVDLTTTQPTETAAPFNTLITLSYTPAADFSGQDNVTLTAVNQMGIQATITLIINVPPAVTATPTPTIVPTPLVEPMKELIIQYDPAASEDAIQSMLASLGAVEEGRLPQIGAMRVLVPESKSQPAQAMAVIQSAGTARIAGVTHVEENFSYHISYTPNDPLFPTSGQWGMSNTDTNVGGINASYAWGISTARGSGIKVAVVDTGVDLQHPDLQYQFAPGWDFANDDNSPDDDHGHGTHVAGIIAARANNGIGMAGVAFNAKIMPIKSCNNIGDCPNFYVAEGIIYATDMGARVINLSLGSTQDSTTVRGAVNYALSRNVVVVAAAGNTGCTDSLNPKCTNDIEYPAFYPGVISVGAHDINGNIWDDSASNGGSAYNSNVLVSAPGVNVQSLWRIDDPVNTTGFAIETGTSQAAAYVSGVAALLMSAKVAQTPANVRDALICGAVDAGLAGRDDHYGYGRIEADYSMNWNGNSSNCKVTLPNDNFQNATTIARVPFAVTQPVSDRSVTEEIGDPPICGAARQQTLWYKYKAALAGYYQFSTLGSSYNTALGIFRGSEGALTSIGCTATTGTPPPSPSSMQITVPLDAGQTYYIEVGTDSGVVDEQILQLRINPVIITNNLDYQEISPPIAYVGMWARTAISGASGGYTQQTTDTGAVAAFSFRGKSFDYVRTVGPGRGSVQVYINGVLFGSIPNSGAIQKANQVFNIVVPGGVFGNWNTVYLKPDPAVPGVVDLDRIRTYDFDTTVVAGAIAGKADDRDARLHYMTVSSSTDWSQLNSITGAYYSTLSQTSVDGASVVFRFSGNAVTLFRMTGPSGFADMQVTIDNNLYPNVLNTAGTTAIRPYTIDNLTIMNHVVVISKVPGAGSIQLDAVQGSTMASLAAPNSYDDRSPYIAYRGVWKDDPYPVLGALAYTTRSLDAGSEASFKFLGNNLCVGYQRPNVPLNVYIDGALVKQEAQASTILEDTGTGPTMWCMESDLHTLLADTLHYARLVAGTGTTATSFPLDYVKPQRRIVLTVTNGLVQETNAAFTYGTPTDWVLLGSLANSGGGFKPQGGYLKETSADGTTITFYINGSGFILYTTVGSSQGCWEMQVDNVWWTDTDPIILKVGNDHYRPLGYGVSGITDNSTTPPTFTPLVPGIHRVELKADTNCSSDPAAPIINGVKGFPTTLPLDFDALRVFP